MALPRDVDHWYLGTMGFSYKDWNGVFYPAQMEARNYLSYYSRVFNAVEIDSTFYGTPEPDYVRRWAAKTPPDFAFCVKVPRLITHDVGLVGAQAAMIEFVDTMRLMGDKLGVILLQFPPSFRVDQITTLEEFVSGLPKDVRFAVEVRHSSWHVVEAGKYMPGLADILRRYGICWAATEYPGLPRQIYLTADFLYIRWIGKHGSYGPHDHERVDRSSDLMTWWDLVGQVSEQVHAIFGFFNNDYAGFAPGTANRFKEIAGLPVNEFTPPRQATLF